MLYKRFIVPSLLVGGLLSGCASSYTTSNPVKISNTSTPSAPAIKLSNPKITEQNDSVDVSVFLSNTTNEAISIKTPQFALINGNLVFSPSSDSQIPTQIPANSKIKISLDFVLKNQLSGSVSFKLAFQPTPNTPEEFIPLDAITIHKPQPTNVKNTQPVPAPLTLVTFNDDQNGITVKVPANWSKAPIQGGDWAGWKFVNPNDPNEEEILVSSGDIGGYMNSNGQPDPTVAIPEQNVTDKFVFNNGLSVGYTFYKPGNSYTGYGVVTVSTDENGYGYVEIIVPETTKPLATQILNSFQLKL